MGQLPGAVSHAFLMVTDVTLNALSTLRISGFSLPSFPNAVVLLSDVEQD